MPNEGSLDALLIAAGEAPPATRIMFRDPIAAYGALAIHRLTGDAWLLDPLYGAFSIRTIQRVGELGERQAAIDALRAARARVPARHQLDIDAAITALGGDRRRNTKIATSRRADSDTAPMSVDDLLVGSCYRRLSLHEAGLGGNRQKGISYPAEGTHVLLFSDPSTASEYGYKDQSDGDSGYRYFGEWNGSGDMSMTGGNRAIVDRSPELYLFTHAACGRIHRGQFALASWEREQTTRDGRELMAIVFVLRRVTGS